MLGALSDGQPTSKPICRDEPFPQRVSRWQKATTLVLSKASRFFLQEQEVSAGSSIPSVEMERGSPG